MHYLMDETFLLKKLAMVEAIKAVPVEVSKAIRRINDIRNALAHSIFPEQRRRYMPDGKVLYQGVDIFSVAGIVKFQEDFQTARIWLARWVFR